MTASRFAYKIVKRPGYALIFMRDGIPVEDPMHYYYVDAAEQSGIEWVAANELALHASLDIHPAGLSIPSRAKHAA